MPSSIYGPYWLKVVKKNRAAGPPVHVPAALVLVVYFVQETDCGAKAVRNNLQEWVRNRITEYDEKCGVLWGEMLRIVHSCISGLEGQISDDTYSYLAQIMYCGYEAVEDFAVEITSRIEQIKTLAEIINGNHTEEEAGNGVVEP